MGEPSEVVFRLFGFLDVTGEVIMMWVLLALLAGLSLLVTRKLKMRPGRLQNAVELGIEKLDGFFGNILGLEDARKYYFFLGSLFIFIIFGNYSGIIPGVGLTKYIKAPTSSLSVTLGLGAATFVFLQAAGLKHSTRGYFRRFVSPVAFMLPLLLLDEFIKPASLALRLFGNVFGEETVTEELYHLLPIGMPVLMMGLSLLFCAIQAVVFTMLVAIYLKEELE